MCGIAVILQGSAVQTPPFAIERMTAALRHRGPDDEGISNLPGCALGHTRLAIIDPAHGQQPMTDEAGRFHIVFNGEIYNHNELRRELEREGVCFRTRCDTELLLKAYIRHGEAVLRKLNGQFAFAIWDTTTQRLFAARDRFGEKPLYFANSPQGHLLLASEIKAIVASELLSPRIDLLSTEAYLGLFYVPPDRTIYENVFTLPPAHWAVWEAGRWEQRRYWYWSPRLSHHNVATPEAAEQIRILLDAAVRRQMVADVPVGAFLSGGLDSSTIVALMSKTAGQRVKTFSAGFGDLIDELPFAREVAALYSTDHHETQMQIDVASMLDRMNDVYDEPFGDSSNIPTFLIAQHARQEVKVVLSGDGGDEIFGGYDWYRPLIDGANSADPDGWIHHVGGASHLLHDRSTLWGHRARPPAAGALREAYPPPAGASTLDTATAFDLGCYLSGDILVKVDRAAMAHGLETRSPFLDVDLAEFVLGLPWQTRFASPALKGLLRQACGHLWPGSVRQRGKQGFGAPVRHWLEQPAVVEMWQRVCSPRSALCVVLPGLPKLADDLRPQRKWTLLCLGLWLERRSACLASLS